jgi:hypothetical protein
MTTNPEQLKIESPRDMLLTEFLIELDVILKMSNEYPDDFNENRDLRFESLRDKLIEYLCQQKAKDVFKISNVQSSQPILISFGKIVDAPQPDGNTIKTNIYFKYISIVLDSENNCLTLQIREFDLDGVDNSEIKISLNPLTKENDKRIGFEFEIDQNKLTKEGLIQALTKLKRVLSANQILSPKPN